MILSGYFVSKSLLAENGFLASKAVIAVACSPLR